MFGFWRHVIVVSIIIHLETREKRPSTMRLVRLVLIG